MKPYRCQICGEVYLGEREPDRCPFCGAAGKQLLPAVEYYDFGTLVLSEQSMEDCKKAVDLELGNAAFYKACVEKAETKITQAIFKRIAKQELEHAELICDLLGIDEPATPEASCPEADAEKFSEAHDREHRAIKFYLSIVEKAPEQRVKDVFAALAEVESEHLKISNLYR